MEKPGPELLDLFQRLLPDHPGVERRTMFGMPAAFVNANMFMGAMGPNLLLRLPEDARVELLAGGGEPFAPGGRVMREYIALPAALQGDEAVLRAWVDRSLAFVGAMPPKQPKKRKAPKRSA